MMSIDKEVIQEVRGAAGLTQEQAAELARTSVYTWRRWEQGVSRMPPAVLELFLIKTAQWSTLGQIFSVPSTKEDYEMWNKQYGAPDIDPQEGE